MKKLVRHAAMAVLLGGIASGAVLMSSLPVSAADEEIERVVGQAVGLPLIAAQKAYLAEDNDKALEEALDAHEMEQKTPYETYEVAKLLGMIYVKQQDLDSALTYFNEALETGIIFDEDKPSLYSYAFRLNFNAKDYEKAIQYGTLAQEAGVWDDLSDQIMMASYYNSGDYAGAEEFGLSSVARKEAAGEQPTKEVLSIVYNAQLQLNKQDAALQTIERLAVADPTPQNWSLVIDRAFADPNVSSQDHLLLNLYRLRLLTGAMTAEDYGAMAALALRLGLATESKRIMDDAVAGGQITAASVSETMSQATTLAAQEEGSIPQLEQEAAAAANGDLDVTLGETLWTNGRAAEGETAIKRGIMRGVTNAADAQLTLGIILLDEGKTDEAIQIFDQAAQVPSTAMAAHVWRLYASI